MEPIIAFNSLEKTELLIDPAKVIKSKFRKKTFLPPNLNRIDSKIKNYKYIPPNLNRIKSKIKNYKYIPPNLNKINKDINSIDYENLDPIDNLMNELLLINKSIEDKGNETIKIQKLFSELKIINNELENKLYITDEDKMKHFRNQILKIPPILKEMDTNILKSLIQKLTIGGPIVISIILLVIVLDYANKEQIRRENIKNNK